MTLDTQLFALRSEGTRWKPVTEGGDREGTRWARDATGFEGMLRRQGRQGNKYRISMAAVLQLDEGNQDAILLQQRVERAWMKLYNTHSQMSMTWLDGQDGDYKQRTRLQYADYDTPARRGEWMRDTLHAHVETRRTEDAEQARVLLSERISTSLPSTSAEQSNHTAQLDAVYYGTKRARFVGLAFSLDHAIFDGTGAYALLHAFLSNLCHVPSVTPTSSSKPKQPAPCVLSLLPASVVDEDRGASMLATAKRLRMDAQAAVNVVTAPTSDRRNSIRSGRVRHVRHRFTREETSDLVRHAKQADVSLSMLATVTFLAPLCQRCNIGIEEARADGKRHVQLTLPVNARSSLETSTCLHPSNAMTTDLYNVALEAVHDAPPTRVRQEARRIGEQLRAVQRAGVEEVATFESQLDVMWLYDVPLANDGTSSVVSDGVLERYVRPRYDGEIGFVVTDLTLTINMGRTLAPTARCSTFDGRLLLALDYNDAGWDERQMQAVVDEWAVGLQRAATIQ